VHGRNSNSLLDELILPQIGKELLPEDGQEVAVEIACRAAILLLIIWIIHIIIVFWVFKKKCPEA
jgi:hypothetical protein